MRRVWLLAAFLVLVTPILANAQPVKSIQQIILYKNAWTPIEGNPHQDWRAWSHAYSATTFYMPFDKLKTGGATIQNARLQVVWQALSASAYTGVGLFACPATSDVLAADLSVSCFWSAVFAASDLQFSPATPGCAGTGAGPHPCAVDITAAMNALIDEAVPYYLTIGTFGNTLNGPAVYDVELAVSWE